MIGGELRPGERLLWHGRPRQGLILRAGDAVLIPLTLLWGGLLCYWEYRLLASATVPAVVAVLGVPVLLAGAYVIVGRFIADAQLRQRTAYGVSDQRVVIVSGLWSRRVTSLPLRSVPDIVLRTRPDGTGIVTFGTGTFPGWSFWVTWPGMPRTPQFDLIPDARNVYDLIRRAQRNAA